MTPILKDLNAVPAKFEQTQLSPVECFYDKLKDEPLKEDYQRASFRYKNNAAVSATLSFDRRPSFSGCISAFPRGSVQRAQLGLFTFYNAPLARLTDGVETHKGWNCRPILKRI